LSGQKEGTREEIRQAVLLALDNFFPLYENRQRSIIYGIAIK